MTPADMPAVVDTHVGRTADSFELTDAWRAEAIIRLGLTGTSRSAAASPAPAFPQLMSFIIRNVDLGPPGGVVDIGAGLGGISETLRRTTGRVVVATDDSWHAAAGARDLFPELLGVQSRMESLPFRGRSMAAALACGGLAVTRRSAAPLAELRRVLVPDGRSIIVDLASATSEEVTIGGSSFLPAEQMIAVLGDHGFEVVDLATAHTSVGEWTLAEVDVVRAISRDRRGDPGFEGWVDRRRHRDRVLASGRVLMTAIAAALR